MVVLHLIFMAAFCYMLISIFLDRNIKRLYKKLVKQPEPQALPQFSNEEANDLMQKIDSIKVEKTYHLKNNETILKELRDSENNLFKD